MHGKQDQAAVSLLPATTMVITGNIIIILLVTAVILLVAVIIVITGNTIIGKIITIIVMLIIIGNIIAIKDIATNRMVRQEKSRGVNPNHTVSCLTCIGEFMRRIKVKTHISMRLMNS